MFGFLKKGFGKVWGGMKFVGRRDEVWLVAGFLSPPVIQHILPYVQKINSDKGKNGKDKMLRALKQLRKDPALKGLKESQLRWVIETALQITEGKLTQVD